MNPIVLAFFLEEKNFYLSFYTYIKQKYTKKNTSAIDNTASCINFQTNVKLKTFYARMQ